MFITLYFAYGEVVFPTNEIITAAVRMRTCHLFCLPGEGAFNTLPIAKIFYLRFKINSTKIEKLVVSCKPIIELTLLEISCLLLILFNILVLFFSLPDKK